MRNGSRGGSSIGSGGEEEEEEGGGREKRRLRLLSPECAIVERDPSPGACQGRAEWMPIIPPNYVPQQYFNCAAFVEKPLSSQELIGF